MLIKTETCVDAGAWSILRAFGGDAYPRKTWALLLLAPKF
jgi:hypothetical protein